MRVWTTHEGHFGGVYHCAKFGWNRYSGFDASFKILRVRLENAYSSPKIGGFGRFDPLNEQLSHRDPQKAVP